MNRSYVVGQRVRYARKIVESDGETVRLGQIGTVIEVRDNTEADDDFGPVTIVVHIDGAPEPGELRHEAVFRPEELEPVRSDDDVQHDPATVVEYVTGARAMPPEATDRLLAAIRELDGDPTGALTGEPGTVEHQRSPTSKEKDMNTILPETPTFPMPRDVPLPSWATEHSEWTWEPLGRGWERRVGRATEIEGVLLNTTQYVTEDGYVGFIAPDTLNLSIDDDDRTPEELAALGRFLLDAAEAMRR